MKKKMLPIKKAVIEINGACNYKCKMCPQAIGEGREHSFLRMIKTDLFESILDQLQDSQTTEIYIEGSGEPTMNKQLPALIKAGVDRGFKMGFLTNGSLLADQLMRDVIDTGPHLIRFSVIGYDRESYKEWMSEDNFDLVRGHAAEVLQYVKESGASTTIASYHLILDNEQQDYQVEQYRLNFVDKLPGIQSSIWRMHNWSGTYDEVHWRDLGEKRTCGRPFTPDLIIRAGGNDGKQGAVVPCCMVLGRDSEAVLGHLEDNTIEEIWNGEAYTHLRQMHREKRFDEISYCKDCDMLYEAPEAVVWSNFGADYGYLTGGKIAIKDYRK